MMPRPYVPAWRVLLALLPIALTLPLDPGWAFCQSTEATGLAVGEVRRIDSIFSHLDNTRSPGCGVGVMAGGDMIFARGYGMANLDHGIAITPATVFRTGSVSKQFTAGVVVMLAQEGHFSLDDEIQVHFPEIPTYEAPITIRHLLHHTSGIRDYLELMGMRGVGDEATYWEDDVVELLARQEALNFLPGSEFLYSNSGYLLLSRLVERTTGNTLREEAHRLIFEPLGMSESHYHDNHHEIVPNRATGYGLHPRWGFVVDQTTLDIIGDGGVFTSIQEMAHWMENFWTLEVGGVEWLRIMESRGVLTGGETLSYAMGLGHGVQRGLPYIGHGGAFVGYRAATLRYPQQHTAVMVLCNFNRVDPMSMALGVGEAVLDAEMDPAPEDAPADVPEMEEEEEDWPEEITLEEGRRLAGAYYSREVDSTLRIFQSEEGWMLDVNGGWEILLAPGPDGTLRANYLAITPEREGDTITGIRVGSRRAGGVRFERR